MRARKTKWHQEALVLVTIIFLHIGTKLSILNILYIGESGTFLKKIIVLGRPPSATYIKKRAFCKYAPKEEKKRKEEQRDQRPTNKSTLKAALY